MVAITTGNHPKALWPGVHKFGMGTYRDFDWQYPEYFTVKQSKMAREEMVEETGFGLAQVKAEGAQFAFDTHQQGYTAIWRAVTYALGYAVTEEEIEDNLYESKAKGRVAKLARSFRQTKETIAANVLNNGFTAGAFAGADGSALLATDHATLSGNQSNKLAVAADLSEASLEDILIDISQATDSRGLKANLMGRKLIVPPELVYDATRILRSELRVGTDFNDINAMKNLGRLPEGHCVVNYLSDPDAWFIKTDAEDGLTMFERVAYDIKRDNDFGTGNALTKGRERYSVNWLEWRDVYGSEGAA